MTSLLKFRARRWDGLWRRGAGTPDDPDNGRLILTLTGIGQVLYARRCSRNFPAMARMLYWILVRRYETELCQHCGRPVRLVFHAPDAIWEAVTGHARYPDGEAAPGVLCPACFDDLAEAKGLPFLRWTCAAIPAGQGTPVSRKSPLLSESTMQSDRGTRTSRAVVLDDHAPLSSVGLVCVCGKAVASIENVARRCVCGRVWIISATLVHGSAAVDE